MVRAFVVSTTLSLLANGLQLEKDRAFQAPAVSELPEDPFVLDVPAHGPVENPRMLAMRGCSGSSAIMVFARNLLRYHGIPVPRAAEPNWVDGKPVAPAGEGWPAELLNPHVNWLYEQAGNDIGKAMNMANNQMLARNETLFFKGMVQHLQGTNLGDDEWAQLEPVFRRLQIYAVLGSRENMLDQVVCQIKDCFQASYGSPVDATGKESDLCFARRGARQNPTSEKEQLLGVRAKDNLKVHTAARAGRHMFMADDEYKANVNIDNLMKSLEAEISIVQRAHANLRSLGITLHTVSEEDLLEFQTPVPGAMARGVTAWVTLLRSLGVTPNEDKVKAYLSKYANTYPMPPTHEEVIYNIDAVKQALQGTKYASFIRA